MSKHDERAAEEIERLRVALEEIACKKKMDAVAAVSMRAIALAALSFPSGDQNCG